MLFQRREVVLCYLPDDLEIDTKIFMDGNVSEANDIIPLYFGILLLYGRRNAGTRLTDDFELFNGGETFFRIGEKIFF